jgi:hypothetical protein
MSSGISVCRIQNDGRRGDSYTKSKPESSASDARLLSPVDLSAGVRATSTFNTPPSYRSSIVGPVVVAVCSGASAERAHAVTANARAATAASRAK